jgi:histidyl-tRNA synthetase
VDLFGLIWGAKLGKSIQDSNGLATFFLLLRKKHPHKFKICAHCVSETRFRHFHDVMKPSIPQGTRDFGPEKMAKRQYIFQHIRQVFQKFGFQPLETPTLENLQVLMGKYGDEGDQLLFKVLNSGDFTKKVQPEDWQEGYKKLTTKIAEKGLRYDLTVPFARFVVMNRNELPMPFKRYQIQPVWRADRPQSGRYREFYQCDADVVGTDSLLCEAEIVLMVYEVMQALGIPFSLKINNRKILAGMAEALGEMGQESTLAVAIDKLDKIGMEAVNQELADRGISAEAIAQMSQFLQISGTNPEKIARLRQLLAGSEVGTQGLDELQEILDLVEAFGFDDAYLELDSTLARGLSYYTGAIFEVKALGVQIGSISGGGRYDNLTGAFGMPGLSGVGISFGVDRIYDVMEKLDLFPENQGSSTQLLFCFFEAESQRFAMPLVQQARQAGIATELYPDLSKIKKQLDYANRKQVPWVVIVGSEEMATGLLTLKNMQAGTQEKVRIEDCLALIKA